jgi:hypothetical protein
MPGNAGCQACSIFPAEAMPADCAMTAPPKNPDVEVPDKHKDSLRSVCVKFDGPPTRAGILCDDGQESYYQKVVKACAKDMTFTYGGKEQGMTPYRIQTCGLPASDKLSDLEPRHGK